MNIQEIIDKIREMSGLDLPCWIEANVYNLESLPVITPETLLVILLTLSILIVLKEFFSIEIGSITTTILSMLGLDYEPGSMTFERGLNVLPYVCVYFYMLTNNFTLGYFPFDEFLNLNMLSSLPERIPNAIMFINNFIGYYINIIGLGSLSDYVGVVENVLSNVYDTIVDSSNNINNPNRLQLLNNSHQYLFIALALVALIGIAMQFNIINIYILHYAINHIFEYINNLFF